MAKKKKVLGTAAQKAAVVQAGGTYDPTAFSTTGGWGNVKAAAKANAAPRADFTMSARQAAVEAAIAAGNKNTGSDTFYRGNTPIGSPVVDPTQTATGPVVNPAKPVTEPVGTGTGGVATGGVATGGVATGTDVATGTGANDGNALSQWTLEGDPIYQQAMQGGLSAFNTAKAGALFKLNQGQAALERQRATLDQNAFDTRRQLAGNFAARGMGRGAYGAQYRAMDRANAQQIAAQTDIKDQIAALNQDFLTNYGTTGSDWLGTATGQQARQQAIQLALQNRLAQAGANG